MPVQEPHHEAAGNRPHGEEAFADARHLAEELAVRHAAAVEHSEVVEPANREIKLAAQNGIVIDRRQFGPIAVTGVLAEHTTERAAAIAEAMRPHGILILESEGTLPPEGRATFEAAMNALLAVQPDHEEIRRLGSEVADHQQAAPKPIAQTTESTFITELVRGLKGSGKQVRLIGTPPDHPSYQATQDALHAMVTVADSLTDMDSFNPQTVKQAVGEQIVAQAKSYERREAVMAEQIQDILHDASDSDSAAVLLGAMHFRIMPTLGHNAEGYTDSDVAQAIKAELMVPTDRALEDYRETGRLSEAALDKATLYLCLKVFAGEQLSEADIQTATNHFNAQQTHDILERLGRYATDADPSAKHSRMGRFLATSAGIALHDVAQQPS